MVRPTTGLRRITHPQISPFDCAHGALSNVEGRRLRSFDYAVEIILKGVSADVFTQLRYAQFTRT